MGGLIAASRPLTAQLLKQHSPHEVNIYERDWRPGGQFQSVKLRREQSHETSLGSPLTSY